MGVNEKKFLSLILFLFQNVPNLSQQTAAKVFVKIIAFPKAEIPEIKRKYNPKFLKIN